MTRLNESQVIASEHAVDRALERVPILALADRRGASYWIARTVVRALEAGRKASRCPPWCIREWEHGSFRRGKVSKEGTMRFVWDEAETATVLIVRQRGKWTAVTVIVPRPFEG